MFDQTARPPGSSANARLAWLAAQLSPPTTQGPPAGRLMRRWVPARFTADGIPVNRRWFAVVAVLIAVAVIVTGAIALFGHRPGAETPPPLPSAKAAGEAPAAAAKAPLVISVVGRVLKPGLVTIPPGARVADALTAAGGAPPGTDLTGLNLARRLTDGEQVAVGVAVPAAAGTATPPGKLDLNTATAEQLDSLPGVGEVMAKRIVDWRSGHGGFTTVEQLRDVEGIGESKYSKIRELVSVG